MTTQNVSLGGALEGNLVGATQDNSGRIKKIYWIGHDIMYECWKVAAQVAESQGAKIMVPKKDGMGAAEQHLKDLGLLDAFKGKLESIRQEVANTKSSDSEGDYDNLIRKIDTFGDEIAKAIAAKTQQGPDEAQ